mgnify:CR=1 FL=1
MKKLKKTELVSTYFLVLALILSAVSCKNGSIDNYIVIYNGNENTSGSVPVDSNQYSEGETVTVLDNTGSLSRDEYIFAGWNTSADGSGTAYTAGATFPMGAADVTLFAAWTDRTYSVTYVGNENTSGTVPIDSNRYGEGETVTVLDNTGNLARDGYIFTGWNTSADGTGTAYTAGATFPIGAADVSLFADWELSDVWIWVSGGNTIDQAGVYGTKGTAASGNIPGARFTSTSWTDSDETFWLFGGYGSDSTGTEGTLNDLWKYDGTNWTWVSGSDTVDQSGTYGTKGTADPGNIPGARRQTINWIESDGSLWLFGGQGIDSTGIEGKLNDLWKYDGTNWTWVSGSDTVDQSGTYGTKGTADSGNIPGGRNQSISWIDGDGNFWLFGGYGFDSDGTKNYLNDLWKYDGTNWTWVSGSDTVDQPGTYGTKGVAASGNIPGARASSRSWTDSEGNFCLFGGGGYDSSGTYGRLNDLWKYDGTDWTWISGGNTEDQAGVYGTKGTAASGNKPGGRYASFVGKDSEGNFWIFGGFGIDSEGGSPEYLNDLWKFDGSNWTWVSGSDTGNQYSTYGTKGAASSSNIPCGRNASIGWIDSNDTFWLFSGTGFVSAGNFGELNDLWKYVP